MVQKRSVCPVEDLVATELGYIMTEWGQDSLKLVY
jgi:hypothetical protein